MTCRRIMNSNKVTCLILITITTQIASGRSYYGYRDYNNYGRSRGSSIQNYWKYPQSSGLIILNESPEDYDFEDPSILKNNKRRSMVSPAAIGGAGQRFWNRPEFNNQGNQGSNNPNNWNGPGHQWNNNRPTPNSNNFGNWHQQYPDYYDTDMNTNRFPNVPVTNRPIIASTSAPSSNSVQNCIRSCPVTSEYNPVCGTNNVTYNNPSRLECAKFCGVDVNTQRTFPCNVRSPSVTQTPTRVPTIVTTWPPATTTNPMTHETSSFENVTPIPDRVTVSNDILQSIFTSSTTPAEEEFDIDHRIQEKSKKK